MEFRTRLPALRRAALTAAIGAIAVPATVGAASAQAATKPPVITKVTPMQLSLGQKLSIHGKHFRKGKGKTTVIFKRAGARPVFVKADIATAKLLKVTVPAALGLGSYKGVPIATRFSLRVLATKLGKAYTPKKRSPVLLPLVSTGDASCTAKSADADGDDLPNTLEVKLGTDPCNADTDGDGVTDGYEYRSAIDLNNDDYRNPGQSLPFPGKKPYPNPRYPDANVDYDGDSLTLAEEFALWRYTISIGRGVDSLDSLTYSDGLQYSNYQHDARNHRVPALPAAGYDRAASFRSWADANGYGNIELNGHDYDLADFDRDGSPDAGSIDTDHNGWLSDDERDEDADGLNNYEETHGPASSIAWWTKWYPEEGTFTIAYAGTNVVDPDSDGDGILDGADDIDHDDVPNLVEMSRARITHLGIQSPTTTAPWNSSMPSYGRVNPFNPCLPDPASRTCPRYVDGSTYAPFNDAPPISPTGYLIHN